MSSSFVARFVPRAFWSFLAQAKTSPIGARLVHGSMWSLVGSLLSRLLGLVAAVLVARILGKVSYGELGVVQSTIGMFGALAGFGMGTTATKFVAEFRSKDLARAGRVIAFSSIVSWSTGIALGTVLFFLAPWLTSVPINSPQLSHPIQLSALLLMLNAVNGTQTGVLAGLEAFRKIALVNALTGVCNILFVVGGAMLFELSGVIWGMIFAQAVGCVANSIGSRQEALRNKIPIASWIIRRSEVSMIWQFTLPALLGILLVNPVEWACMAMLTHTPNGIEQAAALTVANQWFGAVLWLPYIMGQSVLPVLSERIGLGDKYRSKKLLLVSMITSAGITLPFVLFGSLFSSYMMSIYGADFIDDWPTLIAALLTCTVVAVQIPIGNMIAASGRMWIGFFMNLMWAAIFLTMSSLLVSWGAFGISISRLLAYFAQGIWGCAYVVVWMREVPRGN